MDIFGHGQIVGALVTCYCKKKDINIDDLMDGVYQAKSIFISGICDGVGGNRNNGKSVNNGILEDMKIKEISSTHTTDFKIGDIVFVKNNDDTKYKARTGIYRHHKSFFGKVVELSETSNGYSIGVEFEDYNHITWYYDQEELSHAREIENMTLAEIGSKYGVQINGTYIKYKQQKGVLYYGNQKININKIHKRTYIQGIRRMWNNLHKQRLGFETQIHFMERKRSKV